jgi:uncharacterized protein YceK
MKSIIISLLVLTGPLVMSGCVTVRPQRAQTPHVTTTTTEETTVRGRPSTTTVETQNVRSY